MAYITGDAPSEGIVGWFTGHYVQVSKASTGWYRYYPIGADGSTWVLTYGKCVDTTGLKAECWAQYAPPVAPFPYRWNSSGTNYGCKGKRNVGKLATPLGN